ncbi:putative ribonuclease H protein [Nymphaea thermarum]|nr:putative ribonuclease H protein [Nymphaea thermarum]
MLMGDAGDQVCEGEALPTLTSPSKAKSWAAVVNGDRPAAEINMPPLEKKEVDGIKRLVISQQSYEVFCQPFKFSAIATLAGGAGKGRLDYSFIFTSLRSIWPGVAHLRFTSVGKGMFLIRTSSEDDLNFILSPGRWYVGGRLLIANQWHPGMPMRIESSSRVRIWIRLPEVPVEWWNPRVFTDIAELIGGAFVEADEYTRHIQRLGFARIKIEIPLEFCPLSEIELEVAGGKVVAQSIEYETKVKYCQKCGSTGHFDGSCQFAEASKDGAKVAPNAWHLVKVPKRRPPFNKVKENLQLKQNKFEALSQLLEERAEGVSSHVERQNASPAEKGQVITESVVTHNAHASINQVSHEFQDGKAEGLVPKACNPPKPTSRGIDPNSSDGYSMDKPVEKAKKRSLKHREKRCLSAAGRLSLIKHALSLLPSYWSLVVKLPVTTCNQLNKMAAEFLWGDMVDHKSIHRIKWSTLCLPLLEGGVGLRDLRETNSANMAYLVYRASQQSSPWAVLIKDRYCERKGFLASSVGGKRVSNVWHRALQSWRKVTENVGWKIGNGELAKFWTDQWGADRLMDKIPASHFHLIQDTITCSVKELLEEHGEALMDYLAKLQISFPCPPLQVDKPDVMVWRNGENGEFNRHEI